MGRIVQGKWLRGGVERGSDECFMAECETLVITDGTLNIRYGWKAYLPLSNHGFVHEELKW